MMNDKDKKNEHRVIDHHLNKSYQYAKRHDLASFQLKKGLNEDTIRHISSLRKEPAAILDFRLKAYKGFLQKEIPQWAFITQPIVLDIQNLSYFSQVEKNKIKKEEIHEIIDYLRVPRGDPLLLSSIIIDSSYFYTDTYPHILKDLGVIVCSMQEAILYHLDVVEKYLGRVVPYDDNYFASLNSACFSEGTFVYIPKGVKCPIDITTHFRINAKAVGQFERTLIIVEEGGSVNYLESCTSPQDEENPLHAAVVEIIASKDSVVNYYTIQNWFKGKTKFHEGRASVEGGILNFVTKRGIAYENATINWTQVESGSYATWKYPSVILQGNHSRGSFNSVTITKDAQQADTGTKMYHIGSYTKSSINAKSISDSLPGYDNTFRSIVHIDVDSKKAKNISSCDTLMLHPFCSSKTLPEIRSFNDTAHIEHEAKSFPLSEMQLHYLQQRYISYRKARYLIVHGFCKDILSLLPLEFSIEARQLLELALEDATG